MDQTKGSADFVRFEVCGFSPNLENKPQSFLKPDTLRYPTAEPARAVLTSAAGFVKMAEKYLEGTGGNIA